MDSKALSRITYGMYVVGASSAGKRNAQIANTLVQVCSQPPMVSLCINKRNLTHDLVKESKAFSVSILAQDTPLSFIGGLGFKSGRDESKIEGLNWKEGETGAPIVMDNALAYLEVRVAAEAEAKTHTIFVGDVVEADVLREGEPLTYAHYQQVKRGVTPVTAPSYIEKKGEKATEMDKYECVICGYVYDPAAGDPENHISPGTPFEKLPDTWVCPICGAGKSEFKKL